MRLMQSFLQEEVTVRSTEEELINIEIDKFMSEKLETTESDSFLYWRVNKKRFPYLAVTARHYIGLPATEVSSERLFSTTGRIVTPLRSALTQEHVDEVAFLHYNLKFDDE